MAQEKSAASNVVLRFGVFQVNLAAREIRKHGIRVRLPGQPFCILSMLLEKPGEIVTREDMRQQLWASDTFVDFEHSLNSAIKKLRAVLGDSPENSRYVETVPRLGYRFIAPVEGISETVSAVAASGVAERSGTPAATFEVVTKRRWPSAFGIPVVLAAASGAYLGWAHFRSRPQANTTATTETHPDAKTSKWIASNKQPASSPKSVEAYDLYMKGMYYWNKRTVAGFQKAIENFQHATFIDPNYALAYAGLANSYTLLTAYSSASATLYVPQARVAALRAIQLDNDLAEAHTAMALIVQNHDWDWQTSEKEYRRAIELNPNYATAHHWYAEHLMWLGRFDEALRESEKARQLDPLSLIIAADNGAILYFSRRYDRAIEQFHAVLRKDPSFHTANLVVYACVENGMFDQALTDAEKLRPVYGEGPWYWSTLAYIYGRAGRSERARREVEKLEKLNRRQPLDPVTMLWAHLGVGDKEEALADLQGAYSGHFTFLTALKVEPGFDPLRRDPRFQDLLQRVGLADSAATGESTNGSRASER
ncbi:MAG TPA: winged helix-turn-helix domain-containing protein [Candidatus Acidoferrum sp.]|nr:winged helix-turn-helix domain-containing protein [Candidatus Acidoferrum sp.]